MNGISRPRFERQSVLLREITHWMLIAPDRQEWLRSPRVGGWSTSTNRLYSPSPRCRSQPNKSAWSVI